MSSQSARCNTFRWLETDRVHTTNMGQCCGLRVLSREPPVSEPPVPATGFTLPSHCNKSTQQMQLKPQAWSILATGARGSCSHCILHLLSGSRET